MYLYIVHVYNLAEISTKNAKVEMEKITYSIEENDKYTNTKKNHKDNKHAKIMSYIRKENMMKYAIHCTNCRTEMISSSWR